MEELFIESTKSSPEIDFDPEINVLEIKGESYPEDSFEFYEPVFEWLEEYVEQLEENEEVRVEVSLSYLNTSSTKSIMFILDTLEEAYLEGVGVKINWYYAEDNELSYEMAEDFMDYLELPFELIEKSQN
ncbi:MAG: DUF1987 domain-containing protein [Bacillota bacterium]